MDKPQNVLRRDPRGKPILTHDTDFLQGYELGYKYYVTTCSHLLLLDTGIYAFIIGTIIGVKHSGCWNSGVIVGWIAAMLDHQEEKPTYE
jgi:hypothetical protein